MFLMQCPDGLILIKFKQDAVDSGFAVDDVVGKQWRVEVLRQGHRFHISIV